MFRKPLMFGTIGMLFVTTGCGTARPADTRTVYTGGHDPGRQWRTESKPTKAPHLLTGSLETSDTTTRYEAIRVGSRIVGYQPVRE